MATRLLHVLGSRRGDRSRSSRIAVHLLARRTDRDPDLQVCYLPEWFAFCGLTDVQVVTAAPMFGPTATVEAAFAQALIAAETLADAA